MTEKTIRPPAIKQQKKKEYNNTWMTDFSWFWHKDDIDTGKLASQHDLRFVDHVVPWCRLEQ